MIRRKNMLNESSFNVASIICLVAAVYAICYLLLANDLLPLSIDSVWAFVSHCTKHFHLLAVLLLPVYVAMMVFGAALFGIYVGSTLQRWISRWLFSR